MQLVCHSSLGLDAPAVVADVFYTIWRFARGAAVILLHQMTGYEAPVVRRGESLRCEECLDIGD